MAEETYSSGDRWVSTEFDTGKSEGVIGLVFVRADGERIKLLIAREEIPVFIEKLEARYRAILD